MLVLNIKNHRGWSSRFVQWANRGFYNIISTILMNPSGESLNQFGYLKVMALPVDGTPVMDGLSKSQGHATTIILDGLEMFGGCPIHDHMSGCFWIDGPRATI